MSKKIVPFFVLIVLLISVGLVAAQGNSKLPGSGWKSGQQIQNVGTDSASVSFVAYGTNGTSYLCGDRSVGIGGSTTYLTDVDCPVPAGFVGSAVVSADQPIAAIVNVNNRGVGDAAGQYQGTDGADVATSISFPLVKNGHGGDPRTTTFYVQNASTSPNNITATFNMQSGQTFTKSYNNVPANAMVVISPSDAGVPSGNGQVGSLTVTGTQPLAGSSLEHQASAAVASNLQASKAFTPSDFDTKAYCPLYRNNHTAKGQTTGVQVQNVSGSPATIEMTFTAGGTTYGPYTQNNVQPNASATFFAPQLTNPAIPSGSVGSAVVTSTGDIVAVVNDSGNDGGKRRVTTYACFPAGKATDTINIPLAKEFAGGNTTGIQVQNVGNGNATVTFTYTNSNGQVVFRNTAPILPEQSFTAFGIKNNPSNITVISGTPSSLNATVNGVVITANQPIVAIANESSSAPSASGQDTKNYEGFNQ